MAITYAVNTVDDNPGTSGLTIVSGTLTVTATSVLTILFIGADNGTDGTLSISNSGTALTWTSIAVTNTASNTKVAGWWALGDANGNRTVTVTRTLTGIHPRRLHSIVHEGARQTTPVQNITSGVSTTDVSKVITPTATGSALWLVCGDWAATNSFAAVANCTLESTLNVTGQYTTTLVRPTTQPRPDAATFTIGETDTAGTIAYVAFEVVAATTAFTNFGFAPWSEPVRRKPWHVQEQQFLAYCPTIQPIGVQFDTQSTSDTTGAAATSFTDSTKLTIGTKSNRALVVTVAWSSTAPTGVSITWGGQALTNITAANSVNGTAGNTAIYVLLNPASGTQTLAGSWTGARDFYVFGQAFTGVDQTGIATSFINGSHPIGTSAVAQVNTLTAVGNMAVSAFSVAGTINSVTSGTPAFIDNTQTAKAAATRFAGSGLSGQFTSLSNANVAWCASRVDVVADAGTISWYVPLAALPLTRIFPASQQQFFPAFLFPITTVITPYAGWDDVLEWPRLNPPRSPAYSAPFLAFVPVQAAATPGTGNMFWHTPWSVVMLQTIMIGEG